MKLLLLVSCAALLPAAATKNVDIYTSADLHSLANRLASKGQRFADKDLAAYPDHRTMLAVRSGTGSAEVHAHDADIFYVVSGQATLVTGGVVINPKTQSGGEIRGTSIRGGERRNLSPGDIVHIPAGVPHQLLITSGGPFAYFVVKVSGQ
jgi:mannose-6-phosphate isomerase-like protein (cupin superfamily)